MAKYRSFASFTHRVSWAGNKFIIMRQSEMSLICFKKYIHIYYCFVVLLFSSQIVPKKVGSLVYFYVQE